MTDEKNSFQAARIASIETIAAQMDLAFAQYCEALEQQRVLAVEWSKEIEAVRMTCTSSVERAASDAKRANARMLAAARALVAILESP